MVAIRRVVRKGWLPPPYGETAAVATLGVMRKRQAATSVREKAAVATSGVSNPCPLWPTVSWRRFVYPATL